MFGIAKLALDSMKDIVYIIDKEYNILYANHASVAFFGTDIHEITGKKCFEMYRKLNFDCFKHCSLRKSNGKKFAEHISIDRIRTINKKYVTKIWKYYPIMFEKKVEGYLIIIDEFSQFPLVPDTQKNVKSKDLFPLVGKCRKKNLRNSLNYNDNWNSRVDFIPKTMILHEKSPRIVNRDFSSKFRFLNKQIPKFVKKTTKKSNESYDMAFHFVKLANLVKAQSISIQKMRLITEYISKVAHDLVNHSRTFKTSSDE